MDATMMMDDDERGPQKWDERHSAEAAAREKVLLAQAAYGFGPGKMKPVAEEIDFALQIKEAVRDHRGGSIRPLSDFEYVQYGMCCWEESVEGILTRIEMMQAFKEEYRILDTPEDGIDIISQFLQEQPGFFLSMSYTAATKSYVNVIDWGRFYPSRIKTWKQFRNYLGFLYYTQHCKLCHFEAIREGSTILVECMDATLENYDSATFGKVQHELLRWYPANQRETYLLNSPSVVNIAFALWKKFMLPNQKRSIRMGHQIEGLEGQSIGTLYDSPDPGVARENLLEYCQILLDHRYRNQAEFRLDESLEED